MIGRILIVEDDDAIATGLALNLKLAGHASVIARDASMRCGRPKPRTSR